MPVTARIVRKHRAPKGALRPGNRILERQYLVGVRKRQAPQGALRLDGERLDKRELERVRKHQAL